MINWYCPQGDTNNTYLMRYDERGENNDNDKKSNKRAEAVKRSNR